jgi:hypothetical protein
VTRHHLDGGPKMVGAASFRRLSVVIPHQMSIRRRTPNLDVLVHSARSSKTSRRGAVAAEVTGRAGPAVGGRGCAQADATTASTSKRRIAE